MATSSQDGGFPVSAGILFGLGLGGFFDGIILHQVLQWHHMLTSAGYPADSVRNLEINILWDGLFHMSTGALDSVALLPQEPHPLVGQAPPRRNADRLWRFQRR
jgi:uncharacterized membrane protein